MLPENYSFWPPLVEGKFVRDLAPHFSQNESTMFKARYRAVVVLIGLCVFLGIAWSAEEIPLQLSDETFWKLVTDFSEPGGSFPSDNFVSNERSFQNVLTELKERTKPGGVYVGVGPEQNFTYIVALRPRIAFIFDIRRQNVLEL